MSPGTSFRADLEARLRARKLDVTLLPAYPVVPDARAAAAIGLAALDERLGGGLPRGQLSEVAGSRSSGCRSLLCRALAAAAAREEPVALVDALDTFDPESAAAAGVPLPRLLWIRGAAPGGSPAGAAGRPGAGGDLLLQAVQRGVKALDLVLRAGGFGLAALDLGDVPAAVVRRLPFTTWRRLQRSVEGSRTVCLLAAAEPVARGPAGVTLALQRPAARWTGAGDRARLFAGLEPDVRILRAR